MFAVVAPTSSQPPLFALIPSQPPPFAPTSSQPTNHPTMRLKAHFAESLSGLSSIRAFRLNSLFGVFFCYCHCFFYCHRCSYFPLLSVSLSLSLPLLLTLLLPVSAVTGCCCFLMHFSISFRYVVFFCGYGTKIQSVLNSDAPSYTYLLAIGMPL